MIEVKNVFFKYDDANDYTIKNLSFHVQKGEWLSIVGHNGSGKSTTARLLDGLLEAESGQITISNQLLTPETVWDIRRQIGMVFQNPDNQFVGATVEDDVAFGLENQGLSHEEMTKRVADALALVGMTAFKTREPARLSGGQKQRVAIAGTLAMLPDIIIFDEATSMLDTDGRQELLQTMAEVRERFKMTVISITHDLDEVALSDRVLVMKEGEIESIATPKELFSRRDQLATLGLDFPFTVALQKQLEETFGWQKQAYQTQRELEDTLWKFLSKT